MNLKNISIIAFKLLTAFIFTFLLTEIVFRLYNKINPVFVFPDSSYNRFRGKPFSRDYDFQLNSKGFKDVEFKKEKSQHIFRIIGIGDSFTYGVVPYKYNYLTVLEEKLNAQQKSMKKENEDIKSFEIINMGIPGMQPQDYFSLLLNEGVELSPDMVICSFFIGNDLLSEVKDDMYTYSFVLSFLRYIMNILSKYEGNVIHPNPEYHDDIPSFDLNTFVKIEKERGVIYKESMNYREGFNNAMLYLKKMKEICISRNIQLLIVIIPDELQVNKEIQSAVTEEFKSNIDEFDFTLPNKLMRDELDKLKIDHLDLLEDFVKYSKEKRLYIPRNTHWNIEGNKLAADLILNKLVNNGIVSVYHTQPLINTSNN